MSKSIQPTQPTQSTQASKCTTAIWATRCHTHKVKVATKQLGLACSSWPSTLNLTNQPNQPKQASAQLQHAITADGPLRGDARRLLVLGGLLLFSQDALAVTRGDAVLVLYTYTYIYIHTYIHIHIHIHTHSTRHGGYLSLADSFCSARTRWP
jgi:hypothetical protein